MFACDPLGMWTERMAVARHDGRISQPESDYPLRLAPPIIPAGAASDLDLRLDTNKLLLQNTSQNEPVAYGIFT
jgi:hypothetical protein